MPKSNPLFGILALALAIGACDNKAEPAPAAAPVAGKPEAIRPDAAKPAEPAAKPVDDRVLADSGLGVGGKFKPFDIVNCDSGDQYCQVCKFGGSPKIMAVGTIDDPAFKTDLQNLDALVQKYGEDKVKAFAVLTDIKDGKSSTPTADREALIAKAKALRTELGVKFPIVVPASEAGAANKEFDDYYNVTRSRTLMFADGRNSVKYSAVAPADLAALNTAIEAVVGAPGAAPAPSEPPKAG
ncbi:hypothetical protein [Nannocystis sp.]|uniref:hypothetical protein n=1 Tax=Nannocystis sp. TaxID=1962667 RepID=UPI0024222574|nr:hypothetical protein [Nannocystis sp.]MBK7830616.1 hypothetical protein [Nannocystis sp.]MBK9756146.1 hypothetical protein [Nannocystis sp.]